VAAPERRDRYSRAGPNQLRPERRRADRHGTLALAVVLGAAILAGEDGRLLSHNLIFDALALARSDWYRPPLSVVCARVVGDVRGDAEGCLA
jgi:hypothetical protein